MQPHVHISPVGMLGTFALTVALLGTAHLMALANGDNRLSRAWVSLGL